MNEAIAPYRRYFDFQGRSDRKEFWLYVAFYLIVSAVLTVIDQTAFPNVLGEDGQAVQPLTAIFGLISLIPNISVSVRRLHDTGRSGWWYLLWFIPIIGWVILLIWYCQKGQSEPNAYGAPPSGSATA